MTTFKGNPSVYSSFKNNIESNTHILELMPRFNHQIRYGNRGKVVWVMVHNSSVTRTTILKAMCVSLLSLIEVTKHQNRSIQITKPTSAAFSFRDALCWLSFRWSWMRVVLLTILLCGDVVVGGGGVVIPQSYRAWTHPSWCLV